MGYTDDNDGDINDLLAYINTQRVNTSDKGGLAYAASTSSDPSLGDYAAYYASAPLRSFFPHRIENTPLGAISGLSQTYESPVGKQGVGLGDFIPGSWGDAINSAEDRFRAAFPDLAKSQDLYNYTAGQKPPDFSGIGTGTIKSMGKGFLLKDAMGGIAPDVTINGSRPLTVTVNGIRQTTPQHFTINSTAENLPLSLDRKFSSFEEAQQALEKMDFNLTEIKKDGYGQPAATMTHGPSRTVLERLQAAHDKRWADSQDVYLRYGEIPANERSLNHASREYEDGVSVYNGKLNKQGEVMVTPNTPAQIWGEKAYSNLTDKPLYIVRGDHVGFGSDGEPVLRNVTIVRKINKAK